MFSNLWSRKFHLLAVVSLTLISFFVFAKLWDAWNELQSKVITCTKATEQHSPAYFEIQLVEQHPTEPIFEGKFFVYVGDFDGDPPKALLVRRSEERTYGSSVSKVPLIKTERNELRTKKFEEFNLITETNTHRDFPLDSAKFDFDLTLTPELPISVIRVVNRVPGFIIDCETLNVRRSGNGFHIAFQLLRNRLTQLMVFVLMGASILFVILIWWIESTSSLATSVASFFFAMWSIRAIFAPVVKTFPTLMDSGILGISILLLLSLFWKLLLRPAKE